MMHDLSKTIYNKDTHVMLDIETLCTSSKLAVMPSISAVQFNPFTGETFAEFELFIDIQSQIDEGFSIDASTLNFWLTQPTKLQQELVTKCGYGPSIREALIQFSKWLKINKIKYLHGNGPSFDCAMIQTAYDKLSIARPWDFWNDVCVRTISNFDPSSKRDQEFIGDKHRGIDDAKHQIRYVHRNISRIRLVENNDQLLLEYPSSK